MIRDTNLDEVGIYFNLAQGGQMMTALRVKWFSDSGDEQAKQSHSSTYNAARLRALARSTDPRWRYLEARPAKRQFWMADDLANSDRTPTFDYARLQRAIESGRLSRGLLRMLEQLHVYGIAIIKDVPTKNTGNSDCTLRTVANWIGEIRNTFYGETWDVKSVLNSKNIAYTSDNLGLHMDLLSVHIALVDDPLLTHILVATSLIRPVFNFYTACETGSKADHPILSIPSK